MTLAQELQAASKAADNVLARIRELEYRNAKLRLALHSAYHDLYGAEPTNVRLAWYRSVINTEAE